MGDYYNLLEVPRNVPPEESRHVYRQLALRRRSVKNPDNMAEAEARFMNISGAYEVFPSESKRPEYDFHGRGGKDTGHQADFVRSQDATAYNTDGTSTFTHRDPDQLFREFFGSWDPFEAVFRGMHGGQCGPTVLTGGFPLYQQNSASTYLTDFLFDSDNRLLARLLSASGVGGSSAAVVAMQTHQASSLRYVNGRGIETRTIIRDGLMNAVCFEDGQLVSQTTERAVTRGRQTHLRSTPGSCRSVGTAGTLPISAYRPTSAFASQRSQARRQKVSIEETADRARRKHQCQNELRWQGHRFLQCTIHI